MYRVKRESPREIHRAKQAQRVKDAPTLAEKFPKLKSLTAELNFTDSKRPATNSNIKYYLDLDSKSVFRVGCRNSDCVGGDFDLSDEVGAAVAKHRTHAEGELTCPGWIDEQHIDKTRCTSVLKYRLTLAY